MLKYLSINYKPVFMEHLNLIQFWVIVNLLKVSNIYIKNSILTIPTGAQFSPNFFIFFFIYSYIFLYFCFIYYLSTFYYNCSPNPWSVSSSRIWPGEIWSQVGNELFPYKAQVFIINFSEIKKFKHLLS